LGFFVGHKSEFTDSPYIPHVHALLGSFFAKNQGSEEGYREICEIGLAKFWW